jgi:hypothetical protein
MLSQELFAAAAIRAPVGALDSNGRLNHMLLPFIDMMRPLMVVKSYGGFDLNMPPFWGLPNGDRHSGPSAYGC